MTILKSKWYLLKRLLFTKWISWVLPYIQKNILNANVSLFVNNGFNFSFSFLVSYLAAYLFSNFFEPDGSKISKNWVINNSTKLIFFADISIIILHFKKLRYSIFSKGNKNKDNFCKLQYFQTTTIIKLIAQ